MPRNQRSCRHIYLYIYINDISWYMNVLFLICLFHFLNSILLLPSTIELPLPYRRSLDYFFWLMKENPHGPNWAMNHRFNLNPETKSNIERGSIKSIFNNKLTSTILCALMLFVDMLCVILLTGVQSRWWDHTVIIFYWYVHNIPVIGRE